jgi:hypothetical protein
MQRTLEIMQHRQRAMSRSLLVRAIEQRAPGAITRPVSATSIV